MANTLITSPNSREELNEKVAVKMGCKRLVPNCKNLKRLGTPGAIYPLRKQLNGNQSQLVQK